MYPCIWTSPRNVPVSLLKQRILRQYTTNAEQTVTWQVNTVQKSLQSHTASDCFGVLYWKLQVRLCKNYTSAR